MMVRNQGLGGGLVQERIRAFQARAWFPGRRLPPKYDRGQPEGKTQEIRTQGLHNAWTGAPLISAKLILHG